MTPEFIEKNPETTQRLVNALYKALKASNEVFIDDFMDIPNNPSGRIYRSGDLCRVNEHGEIEYFGRIAERSGVDVWKAIEHANLHPRVKILNPGPGVGGHCIPVDPYYLAWRAREFDFIDRFVELAGDINFGMPRHVVDLVAEALDRKSVV